MVEDEVQVVNAQAGGEALVTQHVGDELVITRPGGRKQMVAVRGLADTHIAKAIIGDAMIMAMVEMRSGQTPC